MNRLEQRIQSGLQEVADGARVSDDAWAEIRSRLERAQVDSVLIELTPPDAVSSRRGFGPRVLGFAAGLVITVGTLWMGFGDDGTEDIDRLEPGTVNVQPAVNVDPSGDQALAATAVVTDYVAALDAGDVDLAMGYLSPDAIRRARSSIRNSGANPTEDQWRSYLDWLVAQETEFDRPECRRTVGDADGVTLSCTWHQREALSLAIDSSGPFIEFEATVASGQITVMDYTKNLEQQEGEFMFWMHQNERATYVHNDWSTAPSRERLSEAIVPYLETVELWAESRQP